MDDRSGIFAGDDPFGLFEDWIAAAAKTEPNDPNAVALATADADGMPDVRIVLLKEISATGLVIYTNYHGAKGRQIAATGVAALTWHAKTLGRQIRARGAVHRVPPGQSDAYYQSRALESRLGAWASAQSRPLADRATLEAALDKARTTHGDTPPRPPHWGGLCLVPTTMEFWANGDHRLHDRFRWTRKTPAGPWSVSRLNP